MVAPRPYEAICAPTDIARDGANGLFGGAHDDGKHQERERQSGRDHRKAQAHGLDKQGVAKETHNDGGHRGQSVSSVANELDDLALLGVLGQIDGCQHSNRRADKHGERRHIDGRDNRRPNAALGVDTLGPTEDKVERNMR